MVIKGVINFVELLFSAAVATFHICETSTTKITHKGNKCSQDNVWPVVAQISVDENGEWIIHWLPTLSLL